MSVLQFKKFVEKNLNMKRIQYLILLCVLFILTGCAKTVYLPSSAANLTKSELVELKGMGGGKDGRFVLVKIDGEKHPQVGFVFWSKVFLAPGEHDIVYSYYEKYYDPHYVWKEISRRDKGTHYEITERRETKHFRFRKTENRTGKLTFESGKVYDNRQLTEMLREMEIRTGRKKEITTQIFPTTELGLASAYCQNIHKLKKGMNYAAALLTGIPLPPCSAKDQIQVVQFANFYYKFDQRCNLIDFGHNIYCPENESGPE